MARPQRHTADIGPYPGLVVIYLGMQARTPRGCSRAAGRAASPASSPTGTTRPEQPGDGGSTDP
jgi:hypothetical protein